MNFLTLCRTAAREGGVSGALSIPSVDGQTGSNARIVGWVQSAYGDIQRQYTDWKFLWAQGSITTVPGQSDYALPADLGQIDRQRVHRGDVSLTVDEHELINPLPTASGTPHRAILLPNGKLRLHPTPNAAETVTFDYYRKPHELTTGTDEPLFPPEFHDTVWMRALVKYGFYESAPEVIERVSAELGELMKALETSQLPNRYRYGLAQDDKPIVVVPE